MESAKKKQESEEISENSNPEGEEVDEPVDKRTTTTSRNPLMQRIHLCIHFHIPELESAMKTGGVKLKHVEVAPSSSKIEINQRTMLFSEMKNHPIQKQRR